jgi:putative flippase GtrA
MLVKNSILNNTAIKYFFSAGFSFALDLSLFTIFSLLLVGILKEESIIVATVIARIISSLVNYYLNRNTVFNMSDSKFDKKTLVKYYILVLIQMFVSAQSVYFIHKIININPTFIKVPVDIILFVINYFIQKNYIFIKE